MYNKNNIKRQVGDIYPFFPLQTIEPPLVVQRVAAIPATCELCKAV
jgi:hypothetical protein